jgi:hypothetical protein
LQTELINLDIIDDENSNCMIIDNNEDNVSDENIENDNGNESEIDFPEYKSISKKRKRRSKNKATNLNIYDIRNVNHDENIFEIEEILDHKIETKKYMFYVKWKGYSEKENSWVKEVDFKQKEIIIDYFKDKKILYKE